MLYSDTWSSAHLHGFHTVHVTGRSQSGKQGYPDRSGLSTFATGAQIPHLIGAGRVTDCSRGSDGAPCRGWIPAPYRGTGQALRGNDSWCGGGRSHPHPGPFPSRDLCITASFRRKPESRTRLNIGASILAFHPHPNPLPSRERGMGSRLRGNDGGRPRSSPVKGEGVTQRSPFAGMTVVW